LVIQEFENTIFGQDQVIVESQRPDRVPFDLAAELHLKFDAVAVAYRKAMRAHGLAADPSAPASPGGPVGRGGSFAAPGSVPEQGTAAPGLPGQGATEAALPDS